MRLKRTVPFQDSVSLRLILCTILILSAGLATGALYLLIQQRVMLQSNLKFEELTNTHIRQLSDHMERYSDALYSAQGLFAATKNVDAITWDRFINTQHTLERNPGMETIAYGETVTSQTKNAYLAQLRSEHGNNFSIAPPNWDGEATVVTYLEETPQPHTIYSQTVGFDLTSETTRYNGLKRAKSSGTITATAPLTLFTTKRTGFLLILPLGTVQRSPVQPYTASGYGLAAFDSAILIDKTIGQSLAQYKTSLTINDISDGKPQPVFNHAYKPEGPTLKRDVSLQVADRTWQLTFEMPVSSVLLATERLAPIVVLAIGIACILSAGVLIYALSLRKRLNCTIIS